MAGNVSRAIGNINVSGVVSRVRGSRLPEAEAIRGLAEIPGVSLLSKPYSVFYSRYTEVSATFCTIALPRDS